MKVLFGMTKPDAGRAAFQGKTLFSDDTGRIIWPRAAMAAGLGMIHQHFTLVEAMSVAENVKLGWDRAHGSLSLVAISAEIEQVSREYGLAIDPRAIVADLSFGERQRVEIVKAILRGSKLLILDEPTSNLSPPEVAGLLNVIRRLKEQGHSVVFISHKLSEVMEICDEVVVLRDGAVSGHVQIADATKESLARMMVERDLQAPVRRNEQTPGANLFVVENLATRVDRGGLPLREICLSIRSGEVLAIAGIDGNGQTELLDTLAGIRRTDYGRIFLGGVDVTRMNVRQRLEAGLAYIPVDRSRTSLVPGFSIADNLAMRDIARAPIAAGPFVRPKAVLEMARSRMAAFDIRASDPSAPASSLSGGNQQKIVLAREIGRQPRVLLAFQPTWGLDPGAARFVLDQILLLRDAGAAILYVSAELEEVLTIGDRIAVLSGGRLSEPVPSGAVDVTRIGMLMAGAA